MFQAGDTVRFLRHDYFPQVVGLVGSIVGSGREDIRGAVRSPADVSQAGAGVPEDTVYRVVTQTRMLHDIPEAWLERLGKGRNPDLAPAPGVAKGKRGRPWWMFWG